MINMIFNSELIALNLLDGILVDLASVSNKNYSFQSFKYKFNDFRYHKTINVYCLYELVGVFWGKHLNKNLNDIV